MRGSSSNRWTAGNARRLGLGGSDEMLIEHRRNRRFGNEADDAVDRGAALEENQTRDTRDAVLTRNIRVLIGVELHEADAIAELTGNFLNHRAEHLARAAP